MFNNFGDWEAAVNIVGTYLLYLLISTGLTIVVGTGLARSGRAFLLDVFNGNDTLARAVSELRPWPGSWAAHPARRLARHRHSRSAPRPTPSPPRRNLTPRNPAQTRPADRSPVAPRPHQRGPVRRRPARRWRPALQ